MMFAKFIAIVLLCLVPILTFAQNSSQPKFHPTLNVTKCTGKIDIDGDMSDEGWKTASVADNFVENEPGDQIKPPVETKVLITYDENKLYLGFIAYDNPKSVRANICDRDNIFSDDYIGILLDTYGNSSWGYELFVNPLGIQGDLIILGSGGEDATLDLVWESKGKITDSGYQVECAIPFSSLRFPNKDIQTWKANFWRDHQRDVRRKYSWAPVNRKDPCFICNCGSLTGVSGIKPGSRLDLLPNIIASQEGYLDEGSYKNDDPDAAVSLNAKYALTTNSAVELTLNPDFSQVESDATQLDVNSPYALYYEERRPFFQEGSDLFSTYINAAYTRAVVDPQIAGKFTGRFGNTSIAYLLARDEKSRYLVPLSDRTINWSAGKSTSNVLRLKQTVFGNSYIGTIFTDRRLDDDGSGTVFGGDAYLSFLRNFRFKTQILANHVGEPNNPELSPGVDSSYRFDRGKHTVMFDGEKYWGLGTYNELQYNKNRECVIVSYETFSPSFRLDNGFVTRNNTKELEMFGNLFFRPNGKVLVTWEPNIQIGRVWNFEKKRIDEWIVPQLELQFTQQIFAYTNYTVSRELYRNVYFPGIRQFAAGIDTRCCAWLGLGGDMEHGHVIARSGDLVRPLLGHGTTFDIYATIKPTKRFVIEPVFNYSDLNHPDTSLNLFKEYVIRTRFNYQFTRTWFLRLVVEYAHSEYSWQDFSDSSWYRYKESGFRFEPLLSYKLNPFTIFYIGATFGYGKWDPINDFRRTDHKIFTKFQYLFRM